MEAIRVVRIAATSAGSTLTQINLGPPPALGGAWLRRGLLSQRCGGLLLIDGRLIVRDANAAAAAAAAAGGQPLQAGARLDTLLEVRLNIYISKSIYLSIYIFLNIYVCLWFNYMYIFIRPLQGGARLETLLEV
jgi:hypothetical protein